MSDKLLLEEIFELKKSLESGRIFLEDYVIKKKYLREKLKRSIYKREYVSKYLLLNKQITLDEYKDYNKKLKNSKIKYLNLIEQC